MLLLIEKNKKWQSFGSHDSVFGSFPLFWLFFCASRRECHILLCAVEAFVPGPTTAQVFFFCFVAFSSFGRFSVLSVFFPFFFLASGLLLWAKLRSTGAARLERLVAGPTSLRKLSIPFFLELLLWPHPPLPHNLTLGSRNFYSAA